MTRYLFRNVQLLDPARDQLLGGHEVLVEGEVIREVSGRPLQAAGATVIDGGRRTLMPGLIDCHVHVCLSEVNIRNLEQIPLTLMTARARWVQDWLLQSGQVAAERLLLVTPKPVDPAYQGQSRANLSLN